jgi:anti-sigma regulatory factor (Ser/Thr protein kinase)
MHDSGPDPADPSESTVEVFPPAPESVRAARQYVQRRCREARFPPSLCAEAEVLTGELVSNVVRHAGTEARVRVDTDADRLLVEVNDTGDPAAAVVPVEPSNRGGRGLRVVHAVATSWGVRRCSDGKTVWFDLCRPRAGAPGRFSSS